MSLRGKRWVFKDLNSDLSTFDRILEDRMKFFDDDLIDLYDPYLFNEMNLAVGRIKTAIDNEQRIIVFGDYDVDGITGTAILYRILSEIGAKVSCRIPHREKDGYGLSNKFVDEFIEKEIGLVITVDCGISCADQVSYAKQNGVHTIITDHHTVPKKYPSDAFAVLHPKVEGSTYPYKELTGSGVAFKLAQALIIRFIEESKQEAKIMSLIDLASMGTVADLGPLDGENRLIVKHGLKSLSQTKWPGLKKIMENAKVDMSQELDTATIGFKIGPRINAAGRIDTPYVALSLLLQDSGEEKITELGEKLESLNTKRQELTEIAMNEVEAIVSAEESNNLSIILADDPNWHVGIVGLIAGKLVEKHSRPTIIMQDFGDYLVGSARSPEFFSIVNALEHCKELLDTFGGHTAAAGFTIKKENLKTFKEKISQYATEKLKETDLRPILKIDCAVDPNELNFSLLNNLSRLKPFGISNERPVFMLNDVEPLFVSKVGKTEKHLKFSIKSKDQNVTAIGFNMGHFADQIKEKGKIDLVFSLYKNTWRNRDYLQLHTIDISINPSDYEKNI